MLEQLHAKRNVLVAQRDQLVGQFNMTNGAIAVIDELLGEAAAMESKRLATEAQLKEAAQKMAAERISEAYDVLPAAVEPPSVLPATPEQIAEFDIVAKYMASERVGTPADVALVRGFDGMPENETLCTEWCDQHGCSSRGPPPASEMLPVIKHVGCVACVDPDDCFATSCKAPLIEADAGYYDKHPSEAPRHRNSTNEF